MKRKLSLLILCIVLISCSKGSSVFSQNEIETMKRIEMTTSTGETFYLIEEYIRDDFLKRAVIFTDNNNIKVYFTVNNKSVSDQNGTVIIDGSNYGEDFYAWKIEIVKNGFYFHPFWNNGKSTTDPIMYTFDSALQEFVKFKIDESEY